MAPSFIVAYAAEKVLLIEFYQLDWGFTSHVSQIQQFSIRVKKCCLWLHKERILLNSAETCGYICRKRQNLDLLFTIAKSFRKTIVPKRY